MMPHSIRRLDQLIPLHILWYGAFHSVDTLVRMIEHIERRVVWIIQLQRVYSRILSPMAWTRLLSLTNLVLGLDDEIYLAVLDRQTSVLNIDRWCRTVSRVCKNWWQWVHDSLVIRWLSPLRAAVQVTMKVWHSVFCLTTPLYVLFTVTQQCVVSRVTWFTLWFIIYKFTDSVSRLWRVSRIHLR